MNNDIQMTRSGDIALSRYDILATDSIEQAILIKLRWFLGEWVYQTQWGVDWLGKVLIKNPNSLIIKRLIEDTILSVDGVNSVENLTLSINKQTRVATISFTVHTIDGTEDYMETALMDADSENIIAWYTTDGKIHVKGPASMIYYKDGKIHFAENANVSIALGKLNLEGEE